MITFEEAYQIVICHQSDFGSEDVALEASLGRILKEDWYADRDLPPYDRVTMDGIAIHFESAQKIGNQFPIAGIAPAGDPQKELSDQKTCLEVMTGAILPKGADTVVRYEDVEIVNGQASVNAEFKAAQNIHKKGEDRKKGDLLVSQGTRISVAEIGVGASIGKAKIKVAYFPKTIIISTGDELVEIDRVPAEHQIRRSNVYQISSMLEEYGIETDQTHFKDDKHEIIAKLQELLIDYKLLIISGGVSKGKFDFIPKALEELGVKKHFHKVKQRPGKPFWFGTHGNDCTIFALPGNPISSFMCAQVYLKEWLNQSLGIKVEKRPFAQLSEEVVFKPDLTYFMEVKVEYSEVASLIGIPQRGHGSGDLANLAEADAFIRLSQEKDIFRKGESYPLYFYR